MSRPARKAGIAKMSDGAIVILWESMGPNECVQCRRVFPAGTAFVRKKAGWTCRECGPFEPVKPRRREPVI